MCNNGNKGESCHFSTAIEYIMATNRRKRLKTGVFLGKKKAASHDFYNGQPDMFFPTVVSW